jgi:hypothetical protein
MPRGGWRRRRRPRSTRRRCGRTNQSAWLRSPHNPRWNWTHLCHWNRDGARPPRPSSAPGLGSRTGPCPATCVPALSSSFPSSAPALGSPLTPSAPGLGSGLPDPLRAGAAHTCTGTSPGLTHATSAPGLRSSMPYMPRDWDVNVYPNASTHTCTRTRTHTRTRTCTHRCWARTASPSSRWRTLKVCPRLTLGTGRFQCIRSSVYCSTIAAPTPFASLR